MWALLTTSSHYRYGNERNTISNTILSSHEPKERFNVKVNFLVLHGIRSSLKSLRETSKDSQGTTIEFPKLSWKIPESQKATRVAYETLITIKQKSPIRSQEIWLADCELKSHESVEWTFVYLSPFKCTKVTKLIIFQLKILLRRLSTNSFLKKIGIRQSDICSFCKTEAESLIHLFWSCRVTSLSSV